MTGYKPRSGASRGRRQSYTAMAIAAAARGVQDPRLDPVPVFGPEPVPGGPEGFIVIKFDCLEPPLSVNRTNGRTAVQYTAHKHTWADLTTTAIRTHREALQAFTGHRVRLTYALPVTRPSQCDGANYASGISVKASVDAIVRTGLLVPDDTNKWVVVECVFWTGGPTKREVRIKVEAADPPWNPVEVAA